MSDPTLKAHCIATALGRAKFWAGWADDAVTPENLAYFQGRVRHWQHVAKAIEMES